MNFDIKPRDAAMLALLIFMVVIILTGAQAGQQQAKQDQQFIEQVESR